MAKHTINPGARFHSYVGTPGFLNIHTKLNIGLLDTLIIGGNTIWVTKVKVFQNSSYYPGLNYFELQFSTTKTT